MVQLVTPGRFDARGYIALINVTVVISSTTNYGVCKVVAAGNIMCALYFMRWRDYYGVITTHGLFQHNVTTSPKRGSISGEKTNGTRGVEIVFSFVPLPSARRISAKVLKLLRFRGSYGKCIRTVVYVIHSVHFRRTHERAHARRYPFDSMIGISRGVYSGRISHGCCSLKILISRSVPPYVSMLFTSW